ALLPARLAEGPREGQAPPGGVRGAVEEGLARLTRPGPAEFRAAAAAAVGVVAGARPGRLRVGASAEAVRSGPGVRPGVRAPRRAPDQHHAGPSDAVDEQVLGRWATSAWVGRGL